MEQVVRRWQIFMGAKNVAEVVDRAGITVSLAGPSPDPGGSSSHPFTVRFKSPMAESPLRRLFHSAQNIEDFVALLNDNGFTTMEDPFTLDL